MVKPWFTMVYFYKGFHACSHVFVRVDSVRKPLQQPYKGPYKVLKRKDRFFTLDVNGKRDQISIDRLKVAYVENQASLEESLSNSTSIAKGKTPSSVEKSAARTPHARTTTPPIRKTRSGRHVHWPRRYGSSSI